MDSRLPLTARRRSSPQSVPHSQMLLGLSQHSPLPSPSGTPTSSPRHSAASTPEHQMHAHTHRNDRRSMPRNESRSNSDEIPLINLEEIDETAHNPYMRLPLHLTSPTSPPPRSHRSQSVPSTATYSRRSSVRTIGPYESTLFDATLPSHLKTPPPPPPLPPPPPTSPDKVIVIGNAKSGKSSLIRRYAQRSFTNTYVTTVGADYTKRDVVINDVVSGKRSGTWGASEVGTWSGERSGKRSVGMCRERTRRFFPPPLVCRSFIPPHG